MPTPNWQPTPLLYAWLITLLGATACSWTFDDATPDVPLQGDAIPPENFPQLNVEPARDAFLLTDGDGNPWVVMPVAAPLTLIPPLVPARETLKLLRLDAGAPTDGRQRLELTEDHSYIGAHAVYQFEPPAGSAKDDPSASTRVTAFFPALTPTAQSFMFPRGSETFTANSTDAVFAYFVPQATDPRIFIARTDGSYVRMLAPPSGYDSDAGRAQIRISLDRSGDRLFVRDANGNFFVHSTREEKSLNLGVIPDVYTLDSQQLYLLSCSDAGLMRIALDGSGQVVLDPAPCDADILRVTSTAVYVKSGSALHSVPVDASAPPQVVFAGPLAQLYLISAQWGIVYSLDAPITYGSGIGDGWLGDWQFMQRGRRPGFSRDGTRLRWLENAARSDGSGDLDSATVADRAVLHLARNVRTTSELADGRILAISNAAFKGTQNRLIVIDEKTRTAQWVVDSARDFLLIPGTPDMLVKIVVGQLGYDIRRVPIPQ